MLINQLLRIILLKEHHVRLPLKAIILTTCIKFRILCNSGSQSVARISACLEVWALITLTRLEVRAVACTGDRAAAPAAPAPTGSGWVLGLRTASGPLWSFLWLAKSKPLLSSNYCLQTYTLWAIKELLWIQNSEVSKTSCNVWFPFFKKFRRAYMCLYASHQAFLY